MSVVGPPLLTAVSITMATGGMYASSGLRAGRSHRVLFDSSRAAADASLCLSACAHMSRQQSKYSSVLPHKD